MPDLFTTRHWCSIWMMLNKKDKCVWFIACEDWLSYITYNTMWTLDGKKLEEKNKDGNRIRGTSFFVETNGVCNVQENRTHYNWWQSRQWIDIHNKCTTPRTQEQIRSRLDPDQKDQVKTDRSTKNNNNHHSSWPRYPAITSR